MSHTKEPWEYINNGVFYEMVSHKPYQGIGDTCGSSCFGDMELGEANARRIAACVNACAGLSTEELEERGLSSVTFKQEPEDGADS